MRKDFFWLAPGLLASTDAPRLTLERWRGLGPCACNGMLCATIFSATDIFVFNGIPLDGIFCGLHVLAILALTGELYTNPTRKVDEEKSPEAKCNTKSSLKAEFCSLHEGIEVCTYGEVLLEGLDFILSLYNPLCLNNSLNASIISGGI